MPNLNPHAFYPLQLLYVLVPNQVLSLFHVRVCFVAGASYFKVLRTYSYDIFAIRIASEMLGYLRLWRHHWLLGLAASSYL